MEDEVREPPSEDAALDPAGLGAGTTSYVGASSSASLPMVSVVVVVVVDVCEVGRRAPNESCVG